MLKALHESSLWHEVLVLLLFSMQITCKYPETWPTLSIQYPQRHKHVRHKHYCYCTCSSLNSDIPGTIYPFLLSLWVWFAWPARFCLLRDISCLTCGNFCLTSALTGSHISLKVFNFHSRQPTLSPRNPCTLTCQFERSCCSWFWKQFLIGEPMKLHLFDSQT